MKPRPSAKAAKKTAPSGAPGPSSPPVERVTEVHLEGMSLLKMIKHSQDGMPATVEGLLLGLDVGTNLEVTNVLPFPQSAGGGDEGDSRQQEDEARYQGEMLRLLRAVNLDANVVGWYKSAFIGSGISPEVLQQQFDTQEDLGPNALMLLIDPYRAAEGTLAVRAYRLTDLFMARYAATMGQMGHEEMVKSEIASSSVFEEVPVRLRNTALAECYLQQLSAASAAQAAGSGSELSRLFVSSSSMLEKNMEKLCEQVDELKKEQRTFRKFERDIKSQEREKNEWLNQRRVDNATRERQGKPLLDAEDPTHPAFQRIAEPDRLKSVLIAGQIATFCDEVDRVSGEGLCKLFLAGGLQKSSS